MILITGGAGFIGAHFLKMFSNTHEKIVVLDDLSRAASKNRLDLVKQHADFYLLDIADFESLEVVFKRYQFEKVLHLAAQTSMVSSLADPKLDFQTNALGTFNVLECARRYAPESRVVVASSNKVYGSISSLELVKTAIGYQPSDPEIAAKGIDEGCLIEAYTPYSVSKITTDMLVGDYKKTFGLDAVSLRQSCIYGEDQMGEEAQGWVSWFATALKKGLPVTIYGDGYQMRDLLHVSDLCRLYGAVLDTVKTKKVSSFYNVGGGVDNAASVLKVVEFISSLGPVRQEITFDNFRLGDQKYFVSDNTQATTTFNWKPEIELKLGVTKLYESI